VPALSIPKILPRIRSEELEFRKYLNLLQVLRERRRNAERMSGRPFEITIDPTTTCQLACPYCEVGNGTMQRAPSVLKEEVHLRMIEELGDELFVVWYFSTGEPLLNKKLDRIVRATRDKEIFSTISTNLSLPLSDSRIDELLQCGLGCISVALDGASAGSYVQYRRKGDFDLVVENLRRLVERKSALGLEYPLIEWRFLVFRHNAHEVAAARKLAREWGVDLIEFFPGSAPADPAEGQVAAMPAGFSLDPAHEGPAWRAAQGGDDARLGRLLRDEPYLEGGAAPASLCGQKCDWLYFGSMLFPNGSVSPCCASNNEPDDFGHLGDGLDFSANWNNEKFRDARASFRPDGRGRGQELVCRRCPSLPSQDHQFVTTLRGVLRNAPDWALKALVRDPDSFFHPVDAALMPAELAALRDGRVQVPDAFPEVAARIALRGRDADLEWIASAVATPSVPQPPEVETRVGPRLASRVLGRARALGKRVLKRSPGSETLLSRTPPELRAGLEASVWRTNPMVEWRGERLLLQLGCGDNPLPGFANVDFLPESRDVTEWDLLQAWPEALSGQVDHAFSEDVLEHFFLDEQTYLLAQLNLALKPEGVFRVLMPSAALLVGLREGFDPDADFLAQNFGVRTGADALNLGMRFGGHRWLHDEESLAHLACQCGFEPATTSCAESKVPALLRMVLRSNSHFCRSGRPSTASSGQNHRAHQ